LDENKMNTLPDGIVIQDEQTALAKLIERSKPFRRFYDENRPKLLNLKFGTLPPIPALGTMQPDGIAYPHVDDATGNTTQIVLLKRWPIELSAAPVVAHEMQHFCFFQTGFPWLVPLATNAPRLFSDNGHEFWIGSLFHEPLVEYQIGKYGFDVRSPFRHKMKWQIKHFEGIKQRSIKFDPLVMIFIYATLVLHAHAVDPESKGSNSACRWLDKHYPTEAAEGRALVAFVTALGFHTPEKMTAAMSAIAERYQLPPMAMRVSNVQPIAN
jgi:hypothetical protein